LQNQTTMSATDVFDDPISRHELIEAARHYAAAVAWAGDATQDAHEADLALSEADIAVVVAMNQEWEARLGSDPSTTRREAGFTAEVRPRSEDDDSSSTGRATEVAKLAYQKSRAAAMAADLAVNSASRAAEAAEYQLLSVARTITGIQEVSV